MLTSVRATLAPPSTLVPLLGVTPEMALVGLGVVLVVLLVGRVLLKMAWRLVLVALVVAAALYGFGVLSV
ncbi:hypothetical protein [Halomicrococcus sp. NG-SE-24]|uniref:hypothetical protein n=1 Tax=Halomicrococcus sp. NG-SE-24 TaxID=3436928 RepID=UPI003D96317D